MSFEAPFFWVTLRAAGFLLRVTSPSADCMLGLFWADDGSDFSGIEWAWGGLRFEYGSK